MLRLALLALMGVLAVKAMVSEVDFESSLWAHHHCHHHHCNSSEVLQCGQDFADSLNITSSDDVYSLVKDISGALAGGQAGLKSVCKANLNLIKCLGWQGEYCANSVQFWEEQGLDRINATLAVTLVRQLNYMCYPSNYKVFHDNYDCIYNASKSHTDDFKKCAEEYKDKVTRHPRLLCFHTSQYLNCVSESFRNDCGHEVGNVVCEDNKIAFQDFLPQCGHHSLHCF